MTVSANGIHPTAVIDPGAQLADDVSVGAYSVIGADVEIGTGTRIGPHAVIHGPTRIGRDNQIYQFTSIGEAPQHMAYKEEPTRVEIGDRNIFREFCTVHRGTVIDQSLTAIGNDNLLMAYVHVAHDCVLGNHIIMANGASLAGHVRIADRCLFGGFAMVHQNARVGRLAFLGYSTGLVLDLPPYTRCADHVAKPHGINSVGMRRAGYSNEEIAQAKQCYKIIYRSSLLLNEAQKELESMAADSAIAGDFVEFIKLSKRGLIR